MKEIDEIFADGIGNVQVTGGVVRLDLVSYAHDEVSKEGQPPTKLVLRQRVIMPVEGFVRSFGMQEEVMRRMLSAGMVSKRTPEGEGGVLTSATTTTLPM